MKRGELFSAGTAPCAAKACVVRCGDDLAVMICGGEKGHIGAVALAEPRDSLRDAQKISASASVLCCSGHKEDLLARETALMLAARFNCRVTVTAGLHVDNASAEDIAALEESCRALLAKICGSLDKA